MSRVMLLRHARAAWAAPGAKDFDRPLDAEGRAECDLIGRAMAARGYRPGLVVCSTATRARQTLDAIAPHLGHTPRETVHSDRLYSGDGPAYVEVIRAAAGETAVLIVGHNPMIEDVAHALAAKGDETARALLAQGFPTAGLAIFSIEGGLENIRPSTAAIEAFLTPAAVEGRQ